jgi:hypothetical protein
MTDLFNENDNKKPHQIIQKIADNNILDVDKITIEKPKKLKNHYFKDFESEDYTPNIRPIKRFDTNEKYEPKLRPRHKFDNFVKEDGKNIDTLDKIEFSDDAKINISEVKKDVQNAQKIHSKEDIKDASFRDDELFEEYERLNPNMYKLDKEKFKNDIDRHEKIKPLRRQLNQIKNVLKPLVLTSLKSSTPTLNPITNAILTNRQNILTAMPPVVSPPPTTPTPSIIPTPPTPNANKRNDFKNLSVNEQSEYLAKYNIVGGTKDENLKQWEILAKWIPKSERQTKKRK